MYILLAICIYDRIKIRLQQQEIKKEFLSKIVLPTVYRRACPPESSVLPVNLRVWSKRKMAWPKKFVGAFSAGRPLLLPNLGPSLALDDPEVS